MGRPFDFPIHKLCKQILSKVTALPDTIAAVKTAVADVAKYVVTNNTASKTGIISQKVSYLIQSNEAHGSVERTTAGSQNWVCPNGVFYVLAAIAGAGGGGGGGGAAGYSGNDLQGKGSGGGGGGSGAPGCIWFGLIKVTPGTTYALICGTAGIAGTAGASNTSSGMKNNGGNGGNGGDSKFGDLVTVKGGTGGKGGTSGVYGSSSAIIAGGAAGAAGTCANSSVSYNKALSKLNEKVNGNAGAAGEAGGVKDYLLASNGGAGGAEKTFAQAISSLIAGFPAGKGGAGGKGGTTPAKTSGDRNSVGPAGSAGSVGGAGRIILWW